MNAPSVDDLRSIAEQVWSSYLDIDGQSPLVAVGDREPATGVSASVSVSGAWDGHVVLSCSSTASRNAAAALLGVDVDEVTLDDVSDALGELANIIGGNVKSLLPAPSSLSLPLVVVDETASARYPAVTELCRIAGSWLDESVTVRVLESVNYAVGVNAA